MSRKNGKKTVWDWRNRKAPAHIKLSQGTPMKYELFEERDPDLLNFVLKVMTCLTTEWYIQPCPTGFKVYDMQSGELVPLVELKNVYTRYRHTGKTRP